MRPLKYPAISGLRFYAASIVFILHLCGAVAFHIGLPLEQFTIKSASIAVKLMYIISDGNHGVDLFFVISGFLMARIVFSRTNFSYASFIGARFLRIYPAFLVSLILTTAYACVFLDVYGWTFDLNRFLGNLLFLNAFPSLGVLPYNPPTWSLWYEFAFYLVIPCLILVPPRINRTLSAGFLLATFTIAVLVGFSIKYSSHGFLRATELFAGALIGSFPDTVLVKLARFIPTWAVFVVYLSVRAGNIFSSFSKFQYQALLTIALVLLFIKTVFGENSVLTRIASFPALRYLGEISYSIYLFQILAINIVLFSILPVLHLNSLWMSTLVLVLVSVALLLFMASASYLLLERPYFLWRQRAAPSAALQNAVSVSKKEADCGHLGSGSAASTPIAAKSPSAACYK